MAIDFKPLQTKSLASQIADRIRQSIVEGRLGADDRLPGEEQLAKQFGVSRPTIREALKRLAAQHLIRSRCRRDLRQSAQRAAAARLADRGCDRGGQHG